MKCKINKLMIWAIWLQNLMFRHTTDEFLTDRGIYPFFRAGNYDRKLYRRRKRQCLYVLMMKELEVTVWKELTPSPMATALMIDSTRPVLRICGWTGTFANSA